MSSPSLLPLLAWLAGTLVAIAFIRVGWRWHRETIPPTCRKCGYDVSRRPTGVEVCSECGADLAQRKAIATVRRKANRALTLFAGLAALLCFALLIGHAIRLNWKASYVAYAPFALIEYHARSDFSSSGDVYRHEWVRRGQRQSEYLDHLLDIQSELTVPWRTALVEEFERRLMTNAFDSRQYERYEAGLLKAPIAMTLAEVPRIGSSLALQVDFGLRGGLQPAPVHWNVSAKLDESPDPPSLTVNQRTSRLPGLYGIARGPTERMIRANDWASQAVTAAGKHRIHIVIRRRWVGASGLIGASGPAVAEPIDTEVVIETGVLPAKPYARTPITSERVSGLIADSVAVRLVLRQPNFYYAKVQLVPAEVDRSFIINAVVDGKARPIGTIVAAAGRAAESQDLYVPLSVAQKRGLKSLTFTLVGSAEPLNAVADPDQSYWDGAVEVADVRIGGDFVSGKPASRPATAEQAIPNTSR